MDYQNRRVFLQRAAGLVALAALGDFSFGQESLKDSGEWDFLNVDRDEVVREVNASVRSGEWRNYSMAIPGGMSGKKLDDNFRKNVEENFRAIGGREGVNDYKVGFRRIARVVPGMDASVLEGCVAYCRRAEEFLHSQVNGLSDEKVKWEGVGDTSSRDTRRKALVGKAMLVCDRLEMLHPKLVDPATGQPKYFDEKPRTIGQGGHVSYYGEGDLYYGRTPHDQMSWTIIITANKSAVLSPFSEIIPLSLDARLRARYGTESSLEKDRAGEAISEAMSINLAEKLAGETGVPNGAEIIRWAEEEYLTMGPAYSDVPRAITWVRRNGVQNAYDLAMEDPGKFMAAIRTD